MRIGKEIKNIYFVAICGTAMASLAAMLKKQGYLVCGSDKNVYPPMSTFLKDQGIEVVEGFDESHLLPAPDLVIIGNAMSRGNPEVEAVLERKLAYMSLPEAMKEFFLRDRFSIVVAGTHGKTTTSSMLAWVLEKCGADPSFLIGGITNNFKQGFKIGGGKYFVIEGDEYDTAFFDKGPKFMHYLPDLVVLNNIEFDHADIYNNLEEIKRSFKRLINIIPRNGLLVAGGDDANVQELIPNAFCPVQTFGITKNVDWQAVNIKQHSNSVDFELRYRGSVEASCELPMIGLHNVRNALATIAAGRFIGLPMQDILRAFHSYEGVKRRLELRAVVNRVRIYDDFAHHPTAIRETLDGVRKANPDNRIWAVYEPRSATARRNIFQKECVDSFSSADNIIIAPVHRPDKAGEDEVFSVTQLESDLRDLGKDARSLPSVNHIVDELADQLQRDDIVIIFSNGGFDDIHNKLINVYERKGSDGERKREEKEKTKKSPSRQQ